MARMEKRRIAVRKLLCLLSILLVSATFHEAAYSELNEFSSAANYCLNYRNSTKLSDDRTVLCFDGPIIPDRDTTAFLDLKQGGFFVMRSPGGYGPLAVELSNTLREKNATVILYDYCLSACANYFLVASSKTYVLKNTVVAWHGGPPKIDCSADGMERLLTYYREYLRGWQLTDGQLSPDLVCKYSDLVKAFFMQRGIDDRHIYEPQTAYTKKMVSLVAKGAIDTRRIFWMWHPQNYRDHFGSKITYESYPKNQDDVDDIVRRLQTNARLLLGIRVFYDPPRM